MNYDSEKYCDKECEEMLSPVGVCDFCIHYDFNGNEDGAYTGEGYCNLLKENREPHEGCGKFVCFMVKV